MVASVENSPALPSSDWSSAGALRRYLKLSTEWRLLGHDASSAYAFAAFGLPELREVRSVIVVRDGADSAAITCTHEDEHAPPDIDSLDFAGVRWRDWAALFHAEKRAAQGAVSFRVMGSSELRFLITGLAPGHWEIWRDGWIEETGWHVEPRKGLLHWRGRPGSFFLRRLA
ncbi:MAG: hypothetical protein U0Q16_07910 [Bryobacteraceae bacterium]